MRPLWKDILAAVWMGMVLPGIVLQTCVLLQGRAMQQTDIPPQDQHTKQTITLQHDDGSLIHMELEEYLTGVVLGEMPASFADEALKAQAVAARTYSYKASKNGGKHGEAALCTDSSCCQTYLTEEAYFLRGGTQEGLEKIKGAVLATEPYILCYDNDPIEAVYFSSSGGMTESALAVWGTDYPYLQSVESPGEENAAYHNHTVSINTGDFQRLLGIDLPGESEDWFGDVTYTKGGSVETMEIGSKVYTGTTLRSLLNLRSAAFTIVPSGAYLLISTRGYGHRVGLSQYGANAMAEAGSNYEQILSHYYPGTALVAIETNEKNM